MKPSIGRASSTARPVMTATLARPARVASPCCTSLGTRASQGRSTIGASVPSMSKASSVLRVTNARTRASPAVDNAYLNSSSFHLDAGSALMCIDAFGNALALAQARRVEQHRSGTAVDVGFLYEPAHAAHAHALLVRGHGQGTEDSMRALLAMVRVDERRIVQLTRGARELRQHEHPLLVVTRGDELLGDQVHAVVEARDHAHVRGAIVLVDDGRLVVLDLEPDRLPAAFAEACIDAPGECAHPAFEVLIFIERRTRRRRDLDEDEAPDEFGVQLEHPLDGGEPLEDPVGVVHSVDADAEQHVVAELLDSQD